MFRRFVRIGFAFGTVTGVSVYLNHGDFGTVGVVRFGRTAITVASITADYKYSLYNVMNTDEEYSKIKSQVHQRSAEKLLKLCCTNGGAFIKVGQHLGAMEYLLPPEYVNTMKILHSQAPQAPLKEVMQVIKEDLKKDPEELFEQFDPEPIGAASLAQVHKATLKDGRIVAVKVQHLRVKSHAFVDMKTMEFLVRATEWLFPEFKFLWLAEETKKNLPLELDFLYEGKNCERIAKMFCSIKWLKVPKIHWNLSTSRILTMEFCPGGQINDLEYIRKYKIDVKEVCRNLGKLYSEMIFIQGYIHSDPHPGNILLHMTSEGLQLVLLDHGLYATLSDEFRLNYAKLWLAILNADVQSIKTQADKLGVGSMYGMLACMTTGRSWTTISKGIDKTKLTKNENDSIKEYAAMYMNTILNVLEDVPREMLLLFKTNDLLRGIEYTLNAHKSTSAFIAMSRYCVKSIYDHKRVKYQSWTSRTKFALAETWIQLKITFYAIYLIICNSFLKSLL